jgi:hypothetical protein
MPFTATAMLSNGTTLQVTSVATWQSSNTAVASVSASGVVTGVSVGMVDVSAAYQTISGSAHLVVSRATFTIAGSVTDGTSGGVLPGIQVQITDGENLGKSAQTDATGAYSLAGIAGGSMTLAASAVSYQTTSRSITVNADTRVDFVLPRAAPSCTYSGNDGEISRNGITNIGIIVRTSLPSCRWTATTDALWLFLCLSPCNSFSHSISGTGTQSLGIDAAINSGAGRKGAITVSFTGGQITLSVVQPGCAAQAEPCYPSP